MSINLLIYASTASKILPLDDIKELLKHAARKNSEHAISGFLCTNGQVFLQCIEGEKRSIEQLYANISQDYRHNQLETLYQAEIETRAFPSWSMAGILNISRQQEILKRFNPEGVFAPYELKPEASLDMLREFAALRGMIFSH